MRHRHLRGGRREPRPDAAGRRDGVRWQVDVPGGTCFVRWAADGELLLTGPAVLVGEVELERRVAGRAADAVPSRALPSPLSRWPSRAARATMEAR